jgi:hypothetical protein
MSEPDWWPRDPHGYVFLARALEKIGAAMDDKWTGTEATADYVQPLPADRTSLWDRQRADMLLHKHRPDLGRPDFVIGAAAHEFTDEHWRIARELAQRLHTEGLPRFERLQAAQAEINRQSTTNQLVLRIRPISGGPWKEFQKDWWNMDKPEQRFRQCRIDPDYPFSDRPSWRENNDHWIFATQDSLDRILAALGSAGPHNSGSRPRPIEPGILAAIDELWPNGVPSAIRATDRDTQIKQYLLDHGYAMPASDAALTKAVQRELKSRRRN